MTTATTHTAGQADTALLDWALYAAAMGWHLFPLRPGTKKPTGHRESECPGTGRCADGHYTPEMRATNNLDVIRDAWSRGPWNIGLATGPSGLVVVDLDVPKEGETGPDGATALGTLAAERGGPIPGTYTVTTPSGGRHLYYVAPPGVRLRNTQEAPLLQCGHPCVGWLRRRSRIGDRRGRIRAARRHRPRRTPGMVGPSHR
jgi:hypothetical protein